MQLYSLKAKNSAFWLAVILLPGAATLDWVAIDTLRSQDLATRFPTANGTITRSEIAKTGGSKGRTNYKLVLEYQYWIDGNKHVCSRLRYYSTSTSNWIDANRLHHEYPPGRTVLVYFNPDDPADALLMPGITDADWVLALFALALSLFTIVIVETALARRTRFDPDDPRCLTETASGWIARLPSTSRRGVFLLTMSISCGAPALYLIVLSPAAPQPDLIGVIVAGSAVLAAVTSVFFSRYPKLAADLDAKELTVPASFFSNAARIPFNSIGSVMVREHEKKMYRYGKYCLYHCDLSWVANGKYRCETIATYLDRRDAERLALWINVSTGKIVADESK